MALEDIERLREKVEKDPGSKLFVPLAEEYKKMGMIDEAIEILVKGLESNPGYMSARVSLGKIYLEKGMLNEASTELGKVVSAIPDNLYAHKKLAEIYRELGNRDKAIKEFKEVLNLNPGDEESTKSLADLEGTFTIHPDVTKVVRSMLSEERPPAEPIVEEVVEESIEVVPEAEEELEEKVAEAKKIPDVEMTIHEKAFEESEITGVETEIAEEPQIGIKDADAYIIQGKYAEAIDVYKGLLSKEPNNARILQRIEELKALLKLFGSDKEKLIAKLNRFLESIKKRSDKFFEISEMD